MRRCSRLPHLGPPVRQPWARANDLATKVGLRRTRARDAFPSGWRRTV